MRSDKYCGRRLHRGVVGIIGDAQGHDHHGRWKCNLRQDAGVAHGTLYENIHVFIIPNDANHFSAHSPTVFILTLSERAKNTPF